MEDTSILRIGYKEIYPLISMSSLFVFDVFLGNFFKHQLKKSLQKTYTQYIIYK